MRQFIIGLLLLLVSLVQAQTIIVKDKETGKPLNMVTFLTERPYLSAQTNSEGKVDLSPFKGAEIIEVKRVGYKSLIYSYSDLQKARFVIEMEVAPVDLEMVVVSATRWQLGSEDIPIKVSKIKPAEIELQNPQTTADLLNVSGKVFMQKSQQGGGSPMIRGFATNRLLYSIDGVRMNTAIFRGGNIQNVISLDPLAIESTEVLFGSGSVIYGSDAIGGVMSFQTLTPQLSLERKPLISGSGMMRFSSANMEKTGHMDMNVGFKKWALLTSYSHFDFDHLRQGSKGPVDYIKDYHVNRVDTMDQIVTQEDELMQIPTAYSQDNFMQKIRFKPNNNWDFQYAFHFSETTPYGRYDRHNRVKNGLPRYAEWDYGPQKWNMHYFKVEQAADYLLYDQFNLRLAMQSFEESRISRNFGDNERQIQTENVQAYSANMDFVKALSGHHTFYYGAEYVLNEVQSQGQLFDIATEISNDGPGRYPNSSWSSMGFYINDHIKISRKFIFQGGLRYSLYSLNARFDTTYYAIPQVESSLSNGALTGSLGTVYHASDKTSISANFGTAFRSPNVDDMGKIFDSEPGAVVVPNADLKAEYAYNFDLGMAQRIGDNIRMDINVFYTLLQNALVRRDFTFNGLDSIMYFGEMSKVQAMQNAAEARVYGAQFSFEMKLPMGLGFSTDLNYQEGEEEMDDGSISPSRHAAPFFWCKSLVLFR